MCHFLFTRGTIDPGKPEAVRSRTHNKIEHQTITQNYSVLKKVENLDVKKKGGGRQFNFIRARGNCVLNANIRVTC